MTAPRDAGWNSPGVFLQIAGWVASAAMLVIGSYLATQRDDTEIVREELKDHARRVTVLETKQDIMWRERDDDRERRE